MLNQSDPYDLKLGIRIVSGVRGIVDILGLRTLLATRGFDDRKLRVRHSDLKTGGRPDLFV